MRTQSLPQNSSLTSPTQKRPLVSLFAVFAFVWTLRKRKCPKKSASVRATYRRWKRVNERLERSLPCALARLSRLITKGFCKDNEHKHSSFEGETPKERFTTAWQESDRVRLILNHQAAQKLRTKNNQLVFCRSCDSDSSKRLEIKVVFQELKV